MAEVNNQEGAVASLGSLSARVTLAQADRIDKQIITTSG